jgi:hypothetical protein
MNPHLKIEMWGTRRLSLVEVIVGFAVRWVESDTGFDLRSVGGSVGEAVAGTQTDPFVDAVCFGVIVEKEVLLALDECRCVAGCKAQCHRSVGELEDHTRRGAAAVFSGF